MALATVAEYITEVRSLLQDTAVPYRYSSDEIIRTLNLAIGDARRVRPDMFIDYFDTTLPGYSSASPAVAVALPEMYRLSFIYFITGYLQLRDQEDTTDARATVLINKFTAQLTMLPS
jgi:hypothetical protein